MSAGVVVGDPASVSALAAASGGSARRLAEAVADLREAVDALAIGWVGRPALARRTALGAVADTCDQVARELEAAGGLLQTHAVLLADVIHQGRVLRESVSGAGLRIEDQVVALPLGPRGGVDAASEARIEQRRQSLQNDLDALRLRTSMARGQLRSRLAAGAERVTGEPGAARSRQHDHRRRG